jgi:glycine/D-amino acid oxidase-like deaminating enzyme
MAASDLLIIGGGVTGICAAIAAAERGASVLVVDAAFNAGSSANAGSLHVQLQSRFIRLYPEQAPNVEASLPLYLQAVAEWERLDQQLGPFDLIRKGGLMLAEGEDQLRFLEQKAERERKKGLRVDILERAELDRLAPWLGPQIVGAELCHDEGKLNPLVANARLRARAQALGVQMQTDAIVALQGGPAPRATGAGGAIYEGQQVIVAAAWGAGALMSNFGLAVPSQAEPLHLNITEAGALQIGQLIQHAERSITLKQFGTGQIVIGGGWPAQGRGNQTVPQVLPESLCGNVALAARLVPGIGALRVIRTWAGMNTTIDGKTVLGRLGQDNRIILAVPGDAGYTLGPLVGRVAAQIAGGADLSIDPAPYDPARFAV